MTRHICVHLLPSMFETEDLKGGTAVVLDILRASTTIVYALAAGAKEVIPCSETDEARKIASKAKGVYVLGGERCGVQIPGFDLGNSPTDFTAERLGDRTLVFTTTNGTRAMLLAREARRILIGSFVNLTAVVDTLLGEKDSVHLVCAGTDGNITLEDTLCAGAIVAGLSARATRRIVLDDAAQLALALYQQRGAAPDGILQCLRDSQGGLNLIDLGLDEDIETCARQDTFQLVPEVAREPWRIIAGR